MGVRQVFRVFRGKQLTHEEVAKRGVTWGEWKREQAKAKAKAGKAK